MIATTRLRYYILARGPSIHLRFARPRNAAKGEFSTTALGQYAVPPAKEYSKGEKLIHEKLNVALDPSKLRVADISGGCGSMYAVEIESKQFTGQSMIKQHRMVQDVLQDDIKGMHGIQIKTSVPNSVASSVE